MKLKLLLLKEDARERPMHLQQTTRQQRSYEDTSSRAIRKEKQGLDWISFCD